VHVWRGAVHVVDLEEAASKKTNNKAKKRTGATIS
jgi:hypothetical protein